MPEPYAVRWTGGSRGVGKREVYWTKKDYIKGRIKASNTAQKRRSRQSKKIGGHLT